MVSNSPAKQELPQSDSFSFLHKWQLACSSTRSPLRHVGQPGVTHLDEEVMTGEGYVTFHRRYGCNKLLKSNPKPIKRIVFSTAISRPWTGAHQPQLQIRRLPKTKILTSTYSPLIFFSSLYNLYAEAGSRLLCP